MRYQFGIKKLTRLLLSVTLVTASALAFGMDDCTPEGVENENPAAEMPALFPSSFPIPENVILMSASSGEADEYNPYPFASLAFFATGSREDLFAYYENALPKAGYQIVMWEKDTGSMGFRVKGEGINLANVAVSSYDCRAYIDINISLLP